MGNFCCSIIIEMHQANHASKYRNYCTYLIPNFQIWKHTCPDLTLELVAIWDSLTNAQAQYAKCVMWCQTRTIIGLDNIETTQIIIIQKNEKNKCLQTLKFFHHIFLLIFFPTFSNFCASLWSISASKSRKTSSDNKY